MTSEPQRTPSAALAGGSESLTDPGFIGSSDQACRECRRRKARCNRSLPTCDLCVRYRRHCLYEKHSRTPLTRKHLTEVEVRLERTEAQLRRMRTLVPQHLRTWEGTTPPALTTPLPTTLATSLSPPSLTAAPLETAEAATLLASPHRSSHLDAAESEHKMQSPLPPPPVESHTSSWEAENRMLEAPPQDDFEWCEMESMHISGLSPEGSGSGGGGGGANAGGAGGSGGGDGGDEDDSPASDGMASLTVDEKDAGYLGVASGAALLRLLEPKGRRRRTPSHTQASPSAGFLLTPQPNPNRHVTEAMIDAYFRLYHVSYPILHEPTFRAQYSEVVPRPSGPCWMVLAYVVAALGVWASSASSTDTLDLALFAQARSLLGFDFLEVGNLTLVQALTLASNYQQKRDKPNSGYNYLGLAVRMAMGLGLHKEFQGWNISPLNMEIRRRVWWTLCVFDVGATITFSRPDVWPYKGIEVSLPLNVNDKDLTAASTSYPPESTAMTPYTAVAAQARFHIAARECYERVISKPLPTAASLLRLDAECISVWQASLPPCFVESTPVPPRYALCQAVMAWRLRNLRILMYRPFVIRRALRHRPDADEANTTAYDRCLADAASTIQLIADFWQRHDHNRLAAWYALYFLFQAALIPCICLRNDPTSPNAASWRVQIRTTLQTISALAATNASSGRCYRAISDLCGRYLDLQPPLDPTAAPMQAPPMADAQMGSQAMPPDAWPLEQPTGESPQTQMSNVLNMMWPNLPLLEAGDVVMGDDTRWMDFLRAGSTGSMDDWTRSNGEG